MENKPLTPLEVLDYLIENNVKCKLIPETDTICTYIVVESPNPYIKICNIVFNEYLEDTPILFYDKISSIEKLTDLNILIK